MRFGPLVADIAMYYIYIYRIVHSLSGLQGLLGGLHVGFAAVQQRVAADEVRRQAHGRQLQKQLLSRLEARDLRSQAIYRIYILKIMLYYAYIFIYRFVP